MNLHDASFVCDDPLANCCNARARVHRVRICAVNVLGRGVETTSRTLHAKHQNESLVPNLYIGVEMHLEGHNLARLEPFLIVVGRAQAVGVVTSECVRFYPRAELSLKRGSSAACISEKSCA